MDTKDNGRSDTGMGPLEAVDIQVDSNAGLDNWLEKKIGQNINSRRRYLFQPMIIVNCHSASVTTQTS